MNGYKVVIMWFEFLLSPVQKCLSLGKRRQLSPDSFDKPQTKSGLIKSLILVNEHINSRGSV